MGRVVFLKAITVLLLCLSLVQVSQSITSPSTKDCAGNYKEPQVINVLGLLKKTFCSYSGDTRKASLTIIQIYYYRTLDLEVKKLTQK